VSGIEPRRRAQIEQVLGRELTDDELRPVASLDALSEVQRAVVQVLAPQSVTVSQVYVMGVVTDVRFADASRFIDRIQNEKGSYARQPWSRQPGLGRWQFRIPPADNETTAATLRRCVATLVKNAAPFARMQMVARPQPPISFTLDLNVETEQGEQALPSAASLTLSVDDNEVRLRLVIDVDIYAAVTGAFRNNTKLAASNAPRLARFLTIIRYELHAQFVSSDGLLAVNEAGFVTSK
jgi:hypothetical protein